MKLLNVLAGALLAGSLATAASAAQLVITDVETGNGDLGNVAVSGYGNPWTTPILMTDSLGHTYVVFCDDLQHTVNVGGGQHLDYQWGQVTVDGFGNPLLPGVSNEMGQLADIGRADYLKSDEDGAIAAQAAIWSLEYGAPVSSTDATIQSDITADLLVKDNGEGPAIGLIALDGTQSQIWGDVPEPTTWAMILVGFGMVGFSLRQHARADRRLRDLQRDVA